MKKILVLITSLLMMLTMVSPVFCDEVDYIYVDFPEVDDLTNEFDYTGKEIVFDVPESEYYFVGGNKQINAGEYDAIVYLGSEKYFWEDGSNNDLFYHFVINKISYDFDEVEFKDKAVVADGNKYSISVSNLPEGITATYNVEDISEPGIYHAVAILEGDSNHYEIEPLTATLFVLERTNDNTEFSTNLGYIYVDLPEKVNISANYLNKESQEYINACDNLAKECNISKTDILNVAYIGIRYNDIVVDCHESAVFKLKNADIDKINIYSIITDKNGNNKCEKIKYNIENGIITFTADVSSQLIFVRSKLNYLIYFILGVIVISLIVGIIIIIRKLKKNKSKKLKKYRTPKKRKKASNGSLYRKSN